MSTEVQDLLAENFEINPKLLPAKTLSEEEQWQQFRTLLILRIEELAERNMEQLMWLLYRIDVNENKLKEELKKYPQDMFASVMADAIIEREKQKAATRKKFSSGGDSNWSFDE